MPKQVAVIVVNPVNGLGLFSYLEAFYEHKIPYKVFAIDANKTIKTNSGITITVDDVIANLKGHADEYEGLVFSCGDAIPVFSQHAGEPQYGDMFAVINEFAGKNKYMIGHCGAAVMFDAAGIVKGKKLAVHPLAKVMVKNGNATDNDMEIDGNFITAKCEGTIHLIIPKLLELFA